MRCTRGAAARARLKPEAALALALGQWQCTRPGLVARLYTVHEYSVSLRGFSRIL